MKNSRLSKKTACSRFCNSIHNFLIAMIFVAASTCSAQKSNWYLFQPNNQGINVEFGNTSCNQGSNFFKPIKPYTNQTFQNYLAVNAQTDKKGKILFYLLSTLDSVYLYNSKNECVKVLPGYDISPMIVPLPGGVRYHVLVGYNLYWFNLSDLTKVKNDIFDYQNATVTPSFQKDLINLELAIDTGSLLGIQSALNNLTPVNQMQLEIKYVFSNWYDYISNYDTIYSGNGKMRSFQVWDSDTTWHINNLISDTAVFFVNYKGLHDTVLSKLDTMSNYNPFHTKPASYFARNLLCYMGKKCNFNDSFYNDLVPITGRVTSNCFGGGVQGINVKLFDEYNVFTGLSTVTEAAGYFRFSGTELVNLDSTIRYYVRVYLPSDSNHISMTARIRNLQFDSLLNIDCIFPGPAPLGNEKTEIVNITMHPNPVSEDLIISGLKVDRSVQISIVDAAGSIKGKFNFESNDGNDVHLDISYLCSGFYFIIFESDSLNYTGKIIITRNK